MTAPQTIARTGAQTGARLLALVVVAQLVGACSRLDTEPPPEPPKQRAAVRDAVRDIEPPDACPQQAYAFLLGGKRRWVPVASHIQEYGIASWYGKPFHGRLTANGERYNMFSNTAAHKTLPMNSIVEVTNLVNGMRTIVRINDRGPFIDGRIIDLSHGAAQEIDMLTMGVAPVRMLVISPIKN